jgi:hypothetical protein
MVGVFFDRILRSPVFYFPKKKEELSFERRGVYPKPAFG